MSLDEPAPPAIDMLGLNLPKGSKKEKLGIYTGLVDDDLIQDLFVPSSCIIAKQSINQSLHETD